MSIDNTTYIVYGWKLPYDLQNKKGEKIDFWDDKYLPYIEGREGIEHSIILDSVDFNYAVFGVVLFRGSDQLERKDFETLDFTKLNRERVMESMHSILDIEPTDEPTVLIFSQFS